MYHFKLSYQIKLKYITIPLNIHSWLTQFLNVEFIFENIYRKTTITIILAIQNMFFYFLI